MSAITIRYNPFLFISDWQMFSSLELTGIFIVSGLFAGFLAGLLGIGGGFVVVPVLLLVLPQVGIPVELTPHYAIGTSLLCICVTSIASSRAHHKKQAVDWQLFRLIFPGLILGALTGASLASVLSGRLLVVIFVIGAVLTAIYLLSGHKPDVQASQSRWPFFTYGIFTGCIASLIGIGGGSIITPYLVYKGKSMVKSVGTAAATAFPVAIFGSLGYCVAGLKQNNDIVYSLGYLYFPAFVGIVIFSSLSAPWGARLAHFLSEKRLKQVFAAFLFFTSAQILYSQWF